MRARVPGRSQGAEGEPGSEREEHVGAQGQDAALAIEGHAAAAHCAPPVHGSREILLARGDPAHRPPQRAGRDGNHDVLGIDRGLHAERAADIRGHDPHAVRRQPQHARVVVARPVWRLGPCPDRQPLPARVPCGDGRAALQRCGRHARVPDRDLGGRRRAGEDSCRITALPGLVGHGVAGEFGEQGGSLERRLGIADRLTLFQLHLDPIGCVEGGCLTHRNDGNDRLPDGSNLAQRKNRHVRRAKMPPSRGFARGPGRCATSSPV